MFKDIKKYDEKVEKEINLELSTRKRKIVDSGPWKIIDHKIY